MLSSRQTKTALTTACVLAFSVAVTSASPVPRSSASDGSGAPSQCKSLGKGALGFNASDVGIYSSKPPNTYLTVDLANDNRLYAADTPTWQEQTQFEFFQCHYTAPPYQGKGAVDTWQGYVQAPNGECLTVEPQNDQGVIVSTSACKYDASKPSGIDDSQHFQIQLDSFFDFYNANFLGQASEPADANSFGQGGNYHFNLARLGEEDPNNTKLYLTANYLADSPQKGSLSEMLIGALGSQYVVQPKQFPACTLVKEGQVVLVNAATGETKPVTAATSDKISGQFPQVSNATSTYNGFQFYQCDSGYMGYEQDETNYYGHFVLQSDLDKGYCFNRYTYVNGPENNLLSQSDAGCGTIDDASQVQTFFHLTVAEDGYEVNFLGAKAADKEAAAKAKVKAVSDAPSFGWTIGSFEGIENEAVLNPGMVNNATVTNYKLRFV